MAPRKSTKKIETNEEAFAQAQEAQAELADKPLGPAQPDPIVAATDTARETEEKSSAADLEVRLPQMAAGPTIVVKANPETPSPQSVNASLSEVSGPPVTKLTVTDADDNEQVATLPPDDAALLSQRTLAQQPDHPNFTSKGHWSNPNYDVGLSDEEREKNEKEYAARVG